MKVLYSVLFISLSALAHVEPGQYRGVDQSGEACEFTVHEQRFENNEPHPLNERIPVDQIKFGSLSLPETWSLSHPPVVDTDKGLARFNHDLFQAVKPSKSGALSLTLLKGDDHSGDHKPKGLIYIDDNYRNKSQSKRWSCTL